MRGLVKFVLGLPVRALLVGLGGLGLLTSGLFGGLAAVPDSGLPTAAVDETIPGAPWAVTVADAVLTPELLPARLSEDDHHFLVVVAVVVATTPETRTDLRDVLRVEGVDGVAPDAPPDHIVMIRDATRAESVHPGLPERLGFFWERAPEHEIPTEAGVVVYGKTQRESFLTGTQEWLDHEPRARVRVPVTDRREEEW